MNNMVGISSRRQIGFNHWPFSSALAARGKFNPNGCGGVFFDRGFTVPFRDKTPADTSKFFKYVMNKSLNSHIMLLHTGQFNPGKALPKNYQPFVRSLVINGSKVSDLVFVHNGSYSDFRKKMPLKWIDRPKGETDSEWAFCWFLSNLELRLQGGVKPVDFGIIKNQLSLLSDFGDTNCILSDGKYLIAYQDKRMSQNMILAKTPWGCVVSNKANQNTLKEMQDGLARIKKTNSKLSSQKFQALADEVQNMGGTITSNLTSAHAWKDFSAGEMAVFFQGELVYKA